MPTLRSFRHTALALGLTAIISSAAHAGLFGEDQDIAARGKIEHIENDIAGFRQQTTNRFDRLEAALKMQVELANQIESLRAESAKLLGLLEVANHEIDISQKRQRDFYVDLDGRIRKLEISLNELNLKTAAPPSSPPKPKADPNIETHRYEEALNLFKAAKYQEAQTVFDGFLKDYPSSGLNSSARFWLGNTFYAQGNCKKAIEVYSALVTNFPESSKTPDAELAIATCQQELNDTKGARKTLDRIVQKYPNTPAAETAQQRIKRK